MLIDMINCILTDFVKIALVEDEYYRLSLTTEDSEEVMRDRSIARVKYLLRLAEQSSQPEFEESLYWFAAKGAKGRPMELGSTTMGHLLEKLYALNILSDDAAEAIVAHPMYRAGLGAKQYDFQACLEDIKVHAS